MDRERRELDKLKPKPKNCRGAFELPDSLQAIVCKKGILLFLFSVSLGVLLTPSFIVENHPYRLGDVAERNVKSRRDFLVEDEQATARLRDEAVKVTPIVYDLDEDAESHALTRIAAAFHSGRSQLADSQAFSLSQGGIRQRAPDSNSFLGGLPSLGLGEPAQTSVQGKKDFETLLGFPVSEEIYSTVESRNFGYELQTRMEDLVREVFGQGIVSNRAWLLHGQGDSILIRNVRLQQEQLEPPPHSYPDLEEARKIIRMLAMERGRDVKEVAALAYVTSQFLQPNLTFDLEETQNRRARAYSSVSPVMIRIMKNEMLVREGQRIGAMELMRLNSHQDVRAGRHWAILFLSISIFCAVCTWIVVRVSHDHLRALNMQYKDYLFLAVVLLFLLLLSRTAIYIGDIVGESSLNLSGRTLLFAIPLSAGAMLASIFFGVTISLIFSLLLTLFAGMLFGKDFGLFLFFLIGSLVAAHGVFPCRNRMIPIRAGLITGLVNVVLIVLSTFLQEQWLLLRVLTDTFLGFSGGVFAGILVTGFTPLAELTFGLTTDIRLLELATMDQPLLQELMVQAPGTYHHSIIVGNMVESAAKSIGANSLLAKVAAYYHDIGKIRKPLYFIENQFDCENRHEKLAPSMSSLILISHVKDGVELARQHRLGKDIVDIISQHHGTSFISFFYKKAMESREKVQNARSVVLPPVNIDDYRYPGPKPQTKEAGLVMLADVVEAACRSLSEPTAARIQGLVSRLVNNIFSDGQLDECELTLKDLHQIARHFNHVLSTIHHKRVEYPAVTAAVGKVKIDATDPGQRESKQDKDKSGAGPEYGRTDLKRLGIH